MIRPDSGDPTENVLKVLKVLAEKFGAEKNKKGFKVLPPYIRILQGKTPWYLFMLMIKL